ncbi:MAG TPA: response regulator transcription factor [Burkholderiales bacterium]|nr:response regulator transcription factor [Burkholderiales bacterium]
MRLLLTEDDSMIGEAVQRGLRQLGFTVDWVRDGAAATQALAVEPYELLLLDLGLPRKSGLALLAELRARDSKIPVVILTARDSLTDRVTGLDAGADDYVVKPFELPELAARIRAVVRRHAGRARPQLTHRGVTLDPATRQVTRDGSAVALAAREFEVLHALMEHPGRVLSRAQLEERLYGWGEEVESNVVEVYVHALRRKLGPGFIRTVRGAGYRLEVP